MSTNMTTNLFRIALTSLFLCISPCVNAAEVTFQIVPNTVMNDTATIVEAYIDPEGEELNAVEGMLFLRGAETVGVSSVIVETGGSLLTLWPVMPTYTSLEHAIRFTGGKPEGFTEKGLLFRMRIFSKKPGIVTLSWIGGSAYRNDGAGTEIGVSSRSLTTTLSYGEPNIINPSSVDTEPPRFDTLLVSQDPDMYEGKFFVSFHATDDVSGVARYTVVENQITTKAENGVYVLQDQARKSRVVITAYDHAGNSTSIKVPTRYSYITKVIYGTLILLMLGTLLLYMRQKQLGRRMSARQ